MNWMQLLLIIGLILVIVYLVRARPNASHLAIRRMFVVLAALAGVVVVLWPGLLTWVANLLGIGRGADLVLYALVVVVLVDLVANYKRSVNHSRTTTELARALALSEARLEEALEKVASVKSASGKSASVSTRSSKTGSAKTSSAKSGTRA